MIDCEQLLRRAAHDLRAPLNQLSSFAGLLASHYREELPEDGRTLCAHMEQSAKRAAVVVDAIDAFGQLMRPAEPEQTNLDALTDAVWSDMKGRGGSVSRTALGEVYADRSMVVRLFTELLSNSLKFRGDRSPEAGISAERHDAWVTISVSDNGIGIPATQAETAFEPLKRLNGFLYEGAGMGLTLCRMIVEKHGGRIWIEPEGNPGTTVRFTLPEHP